MDLPKFPPRRGYSLEDSLKEQKREMAMPGTGQATIYFDWNAAFSSSVRFDVPYYTSLIERACLLVYFSQQNLPDPETIREVLNSGLPLLLHFAPFLQGRYPILRSHLIFPDNPQDPFFMEAPLDVLDGNIQEFCQSLAAEEIVDIHFKHETMEDGYYATSFQATGAAGLLERQLDPLLKAFNPTLEKRDFLSGVRLMEEVFPSASAGVELSNCLNLQFAGEAKTGMVKY